MFFSAYIDNTRFIIVVLRSWCSCYPTRSDLQWLFALVKNKTKKIWHNIFSIKYEKKPAYFSTQSNPPLVGGGLLHILLRVRTPPWASLFVQVCEQGDQLPHSLQSPSIGAEMLRYFQIKVYAYKNHLLLMASIIKFLLQNTIYVTVRNKFQENISTHIIKLICCLFFFYFLKYWYIW